MGCPLPPRPRFVWLSGAHDVGEPLALKYRPTEFADLVGQRFNAVVLHQMVLTGQVPPALLFSGPSGVGKTTAARVLASSLEATDTIEVDAASNGGVDQIRKLTDVARYSTGGSYRVVILDEAHSITKQGFEALLKTLEEPPDRTVFVLVTTEPWKIPPTVLSRLVEFGFRSVSDSDIMDRMVVVAQHEGLATDSDLIRHLAVQAAGNVRTALNLLDQASRAGIDTLSAWLEATRDRDFAPLILAACVSGDFDKVFAVTDAAMDALGGPTAVHTALVGCLRDLLVLRAGGSLRTPQEGRRRLALAVDPERVIIACKVMWEIRTKVREDDPRGNLELALVLITEVLSAGREDPKPVPPPLSNGIAKPRQLTFADLQRSMPRPV